MLAPQATVDVVVEQAAALPSVSSVHDAPSAVAADNLDEVSLGGPGKVATDAALRLLAEAALLPGW
jgi:hypothetical protein